MTKSEKSDLIGTPRLNNKNGNEASTGGYGLIISK